MKKIIYLLGLILIGQNLAAQVGGTNSFQFLDLDFNARSVGLGGDFIAVKDNDIDLAVANPSLITEKMDGNLSLNHFFYPAGINYGMLAYGKKIKDLGVFTGHLRYVAYGKFQRTDETGVDQGTFTAGDYDIGIGYGKEINEYFSIGGNINMILSHYESYTAMGIGADVSATYFNEEKNFTVTLLARNIGYQFKGYTSDNNEPLPIEVLAGMSYKFEHAPIRLGLIYKDVTNWDLTYNDPSLEPTIDELSNDTIPVPSATFVQKLGYHTNFSAEFLATENFNIRVGFNFQQRYGLGIVDRKGLSGFSMGFGFKVKRFAFNYAIAFNSAAGTTNVFGIRTNFNEWIR
ncbi:type IX secretion system protein PorQ [Crocinitomix catalasitica]|uniref:type IX secretion system protein PorQ n=1 Tax=Crocinitomix catalasitica TaxID=184607 RepID=UPI0004800502|nr:type IX secretion system protein PorQ [Crocinitomix catalasitica]